MNATRPYEAYTYAYPHKSAYRRFDPPLALTDLWAGEDRSALFLYIHIPFCEQRCGFCNLFTLANPAADMEAEYLDALARQAEQIRRDLGMARFARLALGGGTPTYLSPGGLARVLGLAEQCGVAPGSIPTSVESSPQTATSERLRVLRHWGVQRLSLGVQSFVVAEAHAAGRAQGASEVQRALENIRAADFPILNIDLIYGLPGQTVATWLDSLEAALRWHPEELFLYPLYVRPLTGLAQRQLRHVSETTADDDLRLACYQAAVARLQAAGYTQESMRLFRAPHAPPDAGPVYCVQDDGMVGLGCGARSYTRTVHYSGEYAVGRAGVRQILDAYLATPLEGFAQARHGFVLDGQEQRRRYVLKSLLEAGGLALGAYQQRFATDPCADLLELGEMIDQGLAAQSADVLALTAEGTARSDMLGPWLYSARVRALMEGAERR